LKDKRGKWRATFRRVLIRTWIKCNSICNFRLKLCYFNSVCVRPGTLESWDVSTRFWRRIQMH